MMTTENERMDFLLRELEEYEKTTEMTEEEKAAVREWVMEGNSVHENGSLASQENGRPCDFLDVYRHEEEIRGDLEQLDGRGQANYIARLRGEDTIDNLREDLQRVVFERDTYEQVLRIHGLLGEARERMERSHEMTEAFLEQLKNSGSAEMPFEYEGVSGWQNAR